MKKHQEQVAMFSVRASQKEGINRLSIHRYDSDAEPLEVQTISYTSQTAPVLEAFCTLENALESHGIEAHIHEQDGAYFHGTIIN